MPIQSLISVAWVAFLGILVTHPMNAALALREVELSMLREASSTRSWGYPVVFKMERARTMKARAVRNREELLNQDARKK